MYKPVTYQKPTNGKFTKTDKEQFPLRGEIFLRSFQSRNVALQRIPNQTNDAAPSHDVVEWLDDRLIPLGAAWLKTTKNGRNFFSVTLNSEDLLKTVNFTLFQNDDDENVYDVVLSRPRVKKDTAGESNA